MPARHNGPVSSNVRPHKPALPPIFQGELMSHEEAVSRWSAKRCPFGIGDPNCITTSCGAWRAWDIPSTHETHTERRKSDSRPGWFSEWKVVQVHPGGSYTQFDPDIGDYGRNVTRTFSTTYTIERTITQTRGGSSGGTCGRLNPP